MPASWKRHGMKRDSKYQAWLLLYIHLVCMKKSLMPTIRPSATSSNSNSLITAIRVPDWLFSRLSQAFSSLTCYGFLSFIDLSTPPHRPFPLPNGRRGVASCREWPEINSREVVSNLTTFPHSLPPCCVIVLREFKIWLVRFRRRLAVCVRCASRELKKNAVVFPEAQIK